MKRILSLMAVLLSTFIYAQTTVTGTIVSNDNTPIPGANVVFDATTGAVSDFDGNFTIVVNASPPFDLTISSIGFEASTINVTADNLSIDVSLSDSTNLLDEVVLSASRTPERLFESPVTVERFDYKDIAQSTGSSFYQSLENLKGVQINQGAMLLPIINTRGFSTIDNTGFVQLVDGMDNAAPGLNFAAGNLVGINEIDIQSVELLPGAASALYGANAVKGIMLMNSKSPFDFPGFSAYIKSGVTSSDNGGDNSYYDAAVRLAKNWNDKFALKAVVSIVEGTDWVAGDYRDRNLLSGGETPLSIEDQSYLPGYNGVNVYGEIPQTINYTNVFRANVLPVFVQQGLLSSAQAAGVNQIFGVFAPDYFGTEIVRNTGYKEMELHDGGTSSFKVDLSAHYRIDGNKELIWNSKIGNGSTIYHATNRNNLKNFQLQQHKLEYRTPKLTARAYTTIEDSGNTHDMEFLGIRMALAQPGGLGGWFNSYLNTYFVDAAALINPNPQTALNTILGGIQQGITDFDSLLSLYGKNDSSAHKSARLAANQNMLKPGSEAFNNALLNATTNPISEGGAAILDQSKANSVEFNYNLGDLVPTFDLSIGGSVREYVLRSNGSLFTDYDTPIKFNEIAFYTQAQKELFEGAVKLTGSVRYDKSQFLEGHFTPRVGALVYLSPRHNIRASYQTGFRNPSSQDLYISLDVAQVVIIGTSPDSVERFNMDLVGASSLNSYNVTGSMVQNNSYTLAAAGGVFEKAELDNVKPEFVNTKEFGYRYNGKKVSVDISAYWSKFTDFITEVQVVTPLYGSVANLSGAAAVAAGDFRVFSWNTNTNNEVTTKGISAGVDARLGKFDIGSSISYNELKSDDQDPDFISYFNTPPIRAKFSFGSINLTDKFGFNVSARYHNDFKWEGTFLSYDIPENLTFDASLNFDVPDLKGKIKVGAVNISGDDYMPYAGGGMIGSTYYVQYTLNP
ncbi:MAG: TonB-dependent receptor [Bacteroidota bacterium]|nr:TonB-dependent receptor [Bacteroidota bacterium]